MSSEKKTCAIISGGERAPLTGIERADFIIACDKGLEYALSAGVRPDLVIGDFDSFSGMLPEELPVMHLNVEKDDTDTLSAVRCALARGYTHIDIFCALGGRLDHLFANIQTMAFAVSEGADVRILGEKEELFAFTGKSMVFPKREGWSLSVFALNEKCENVCIKGAKYLLDNAVLTNTFPIGTSNQWIEDIDISVGKGVLLVMCCCLP